MSGRVWAMAGDVAQWIRRWLIHDVVNTVGGSIKGSRGSIGALMQNDVEMTNHIKNIDRSSVSPMLPCS